MKLIASSKPKHWLLVCIALFLLLIGNNLTGVDIPSLTGIPYADRDYDEDGLTNAVEAEIGTYPWNAYSDGDLLKDGEDAVPLNGAMKVPAAPESQYAIVDLGESATVGIAQGLNDSGEVLLARGIPEEIVLWSAGTFITVRGVVPWASREVWGPLQDGSVYYNSEADAGGASPLVRWTRSGTNTVGIANDSPGFNWGESYGTWTGPAGTAVVQGPAATALAAGASSLEAYVVGHIGEENLQSKSASGRILRMNDAHMKMVHATMSRSGSMYYTENDWNLSYQAGGTAYMQGWIHDTALQSETAYVNWTGQATGGRFPVDGTDPEQYEELLNESVGIPGISTGVGGVVGRVMVNIDNFGIYDVKGASATQGVVVVNGVHTNIPGCAQVFDLNVSTTEEGPYFLGNHTANNPSLYGNATTLWCYNGGSFSSIELKGLAYNWGVVVGRMISNRLVIPMNYVIWRNSRIRSLHELCGNPSEWSPIFAESITPNGLMLAGATKIKDNQGNDLPSNERKPHELLLLPIEIREYAREPSTAEHPGDFIPDSSDPSGRKTKCINELRVAKWEKAFTAEDRYELPAANFVEEDPSSFFIRISDTAKAGQTSITGKLKIKSSIMFDEATPLLGGWVFPGVKVALDSGNTVDLFAVPGQPGVFQTKALMLMSNHDDDDYVVYGTEDDAAGDRTFRALPGADIEMEYEMSPNVVARSQIKVECKKVIKVKAFNMRGDFGSLAINHDRAVYWLNSAVECMAQAGIRMEWELSDQNENPPDTNMGSFNGLGQPYIIGDAHTPIGTEFPIESKSLMDALPVDEGMIAVYFVNRFDSPDTSLLAGNSTVDNLVALADKKYANKIFINTQRAVSPFTIAHELVHVLARAFHSIVGIPSILQEEEDAWYNCFYKTSNNESGIKGMKRLTDLEVQKMRSSPLAK